MSRPEPTFVSPPAPVICPVYVVLVLSPPTVIAVALVKSVPLPVIDAKTLSPVETWPSTLLRGPPPTRVALRIAKFTSVGPVCENAGPPLASAPPMGRSVPLPVIPFVSVITAGEPMVSKTPLLTTRPGTVSAKRRSVPDEIVVVPACMEKLDVMSSLPGPAFRRLPGPDRPPGRVKSESFVIVRSPWRSRALATECGPPVTLSAAPAPPKLRVLPTMSCGGPTRSIRFTCHGASATAIVRLEGPNVRKVE